MDKKIYFAHAINTYGTDIEKAAEQLISHVLCVGDRGQIENPNTPIHQKGYTECAKRAEQADKNHGGMNYFFDLVLPKCGGCVTMPFLDGKFGLGVAGEALWFADRGKTVWLMEPTRDVDDITHENLELFIAGPISSGLFRIRPFSIAQLGMLRVEKEAVSSLALTHEETRLRTWLVYGKAMRPYENAHLVSLPMPEGFYPGN